METRIATEFGKDLYDVYRWPMRKKLVYTQHLQAWDKAQRQAQEGEGPMDQMDTSDITQSAQDMGQMPSVGGQRQQQPATGSSNVHPDLYEYTSGKGGVVNVQNPGEDMGLERREEIRHGDDGKFDDGVEIDEAERRKKGKVSVDSVNPNTIDQASEK